MKKALFFSLMLCSLPFAMSACSDSDDDQICDKGATRCSGDVIEKCDGAHWVAGQNCAMTEGAGNTACFVVSNAAVCKPICANNMVEGENAPACYSNATPNPSVAKTTCTKDDNNKLYASKIDIVETCDSGLCEDAQCKPPVRG